MCLCRVWFWIQTAKNLFKPTVFVWSECVMNKKMNVNCDRPIMRKAGTRLAGLNLELILPWPVSHFINHTSSSSLVPVFEQIIWIYKFKSVFYQTLMTNFGALFGMISPHFDLWKILHIDLDYLVFDQFVLANNIWVVDIIQYWYSFTHCPLHPCTHSAN